MRLRVGELKLLREVYRALPDDMTNTTKEQFGAMIKRLEDKLIEHNEKNKQFIEQYKNTDGGHKALNAASLRYYYKTNGKKTSR